MKQEWRKKIMNALQSMRLILNSSKMICEVMLCSNAITNQMQRFHHFIIHHRWSAMNMHVCVSALDFNAVWKIPNVCNHSFETEHFEMPIHVFVLFSLLLWMEKRKLNKQKCISIYSSDDFWSSKDSSFKWNYIKYYCFFSLLKFKYIQKAKRTENACVQYWRQEKVLCFSEINVGWSILKLAGVWKP